MPYSEYLSFRRRFFEPLQELVEVVLRLVAQDGLGLADIVASVNLGNPQIMAGQEFQRAGPVTLDDRLRILRQLRPIGIRERLVAMDQERLALELFRRDGP